MNKTATSFDPATTPRSTSVGKEGEKGHAKDLRNRKAMAIGAGILWFFLFAGGILIDANESREALGWKKEQAVSQEDMDLLAEVLLTEDTEKSKVDNGVTASNLKPEQQAQGKNGSKLTRVLEETLMHQKKNKPPKSYSTSERVGHFFQAALFFTPLNVALLALLAGLVGGCSSSGADHSLIMRDLESARAKKEQDRDPVQIRLLTRRLQYLRESPVYSMIRSFVVYLVLIAGVYAFSSDPFNQDSQSRGFSQYMRLAGLVSLLGFVVGYDPTRFVDQWLPLIPSPSRPGVSEKPEAHTEEVIHTKTITETEKEVHKKTPAVPVAGSEPSTTPAGNGESKI